MNRRLLLLCYFFPPHGGGGVPRVLGFVRHLPAHGWDVSVVCAAANDYWVLDERLLERVPPATEVVRVAGGSPLGAWLALRQKDRGARPPGTFGLLRRLADFWLVPDPYAPWAPRARATAARLLARGGFDAMLSSSPPDSVHLAAESLHRTTGIPWAADFRDPWMGLYHRRPPTAWHATRQRALEQRVLAGASLVLAASRAHADALTARTDVTPRRVLHLPNGFEPDSGADVGAMDSEREQGKFVVAFTGTLARAPAMVTFLDALHEVLAHRPEARRRLRVTIAGPYETGYADRAIALGLTPGIVTFAGPLAHAESRALQRRADLLLLWKTERMEATVPGKLYEYLDSGRPVLALLPAGDEAAVLVERAGGTRVDAGDRAAVAAALDAAYLAWTERGRAPARRAEWLAGHERAALAARLAAALDAMLAPVAAGTGAPR